MARIVLLIVEDDPLVAQVLQKSLSNLGYDVCAVVHSGEAAIQTASQHQPDLVLMDIELAGDIDGITAAQIIREECNTAIVYVTAHSEEALLQRARMTGPLSYILKPFRPEQLRVALEMALQQVYYDRLTGIPNQTYFSQYVAEQLAQFHRRAIAPFAVLVLQMGQFKAINNSLGSKAGDRILCTLAQRLQTHYAYTARLSGAKFGLLIPNVHTATIAAHMTELRSLLEPPVKLGVKQIHPTFNIGLVNVSEHHQTAEGLLQEANLALEEARTRLGQDWVAYTPRFQAQVVRRLQLEQELRQALVNQELHAYYQPIVSLETGQIVRFEALVRWQHPIRGLLTPGQFLEVAGDSGLIVPLGWQVLRQALHQLSSWRPQLNHTDLAMSVNLSGQQLIQPDLIEQVQTALAGAGVSPQHLHLEITEDTLTQHFNHATTTLKALEAIQVQLEIDDFGTGYSSLSRLYQMPIRTLKIDRSFIQRLGTTTAGTGLVQTIIALGQNLNLQVVAEGIETAEQVKILRSLGCRYGQGYLFGQPAAAAHLEQSLASHATLALPQEVSELEKAISTHQ
ncbi:MAG: EAL domain-containing protein [Cyanobacteria bacterium P01_H01_bin.121]